MKIVAPGLDDGFQRDPTVVSGLFVENYNLNRPKAGNKVGDHPVIKAFGDHRSVHDANRLHAFDAERSDNRPILATVHRSFVAYAHTSFGSVDDHRKVRSSDHQVVPD